MFFKCCIFDVCLEVALTIWPGSNLDPWTHCLSNPGAAKDQPPDSGPFLQQGSHYWRKKTYAKGILWEIYECVSEFLSYFRAQKVEKHWQFCTRGLEGCPKKHNKLLPKCDKASVTHSCIFIYFLENPFKRWIFFFILSPVGVYVWVCGWGSRLLCKY